GSAPEQCCSKSIEARSTVPSPASARSSTTNRPVSCVHEKAMFMPAVRFATGHQVAAYEAPFRRTCPLGALNVSRRVEVKPDPEMVSIAKSIWRPDWLDVARMAVDCAENTSRRAALAVDLAPAAQSSSVM